MRKGRAAWAPCRPSPWLGGMRSLRLAGRPSGSLQKYATLNSVSSFFM